MADQDVLHDLTEEIAEQQSEQSRLLRISEQSRVPISQPQFLALVNAPDSIERLNLDFEIDLNGNRWLISANHVGTMLIETNVGPLTVQVEPKIRGADIYQMVDRTSRTIGSSSHKSTIGMGNFNPAFAFLDIFSRTIHQFLSEHRFSEYEINSRNTPGAVAGKPDIGSYVRNNLPRLRPHIMPTRVVQRTRNGAANQILLYGISRALRLIADLRQKNLEGVSTMLYQCSTFLNGVEHRRFTSREIRNFSYTRRDSHFKQVHELCADLIDGVSLGYGSLRRSTTPGFSLNMPDLYERYVSCVFKSALGDLFVDRKAELIYSTDNGSSEIRLDGLIRTVLTRTVVEMKYRDLDNQIGSGQPSVPEQHLYQTISYLSHRQIRSTTGFIVYPSSTVASPHVEIRGVIRDFGRSPTSNSYSQIWILRLNLGSPFEEVVKGIRETVYSTIPLE